MYVQTKKKILKIFPLFLSKFIIKLKKKFSPFLDTKKKAKNAAHKKKPAQVYTTKMPIRTGRPWQSERCAGKKFFSLPVAIFVLT